MRFSTIVSIVTLVWGISPRQPSGKNKYHHMAA
ncbi:hypothetical protein Asd1617_01935 [Shigella dysenteriae 1617]|uniref:Uncharacterized protein n=1 Tax=Shigella dysenteriae 1617 TaxID=754093 RepID=A0A0A6ZRX2_SHIDY|nr:hypothetical protein Asd1617_01935 [Shigella dysenteriae 1617]